MAVEYTINGRVFGRYKQICDMVKVLTGGEFHVSRYKMDIGKIVKIRKLRLWRI